MILWKPALDTCFGGENNLQKRFLPRVSDGREIVLEHAQSFW